VASPSARPPSTGTVSDLAELIRSRKSCSRPWSLLACRRRRSDWTTVDQRSTAAPPTTRSDQISTIVRYLTALAVFGQNIVDIFYRNLMLSQADAAVPCGLLIQMSRRMSLDTPVTHAEAAESVTNWYRVCIRGDTFGVTLSTVWPIG